MAIQKEKGQWQCESCDNEYDNEEDADGCCTRD